MSKACEVQSHRGFSPVSKMLHPNVKPFNGFKTRAFARLQTVKTVRAIF